jgi:diacylglycerol kinase (ATP)
MTKNKSFHFILNPISGPNRDPKKIRESIDTIFKGFPSFSYKIIETEYAGHARILAKKCAEESIDCVVAIGGDGTVNEIASGLVGTDTGLGIIPAGSGNGFARNLSIPLNHRKAIYHLCNAEKHEIDTAKMNEHFFLGVAGIGFDAHISDCFSKVKIRGKWPYFKLSTLEFFKYKTKQYSIEVDEKCISENAFLVSVANSKEYGNGAIIAPKADSADGFLDLCIIHKFPVYYIPILVKHIFFGSINKSRYTTYIKGKNIELNSDKLMISHVDGEPISASEKISISINPKSLYVLS